MGLGAIGWPALIDPTRADVTLKRPEAVLVPRRPTCNHLRTMKLARAGAQILPASPGFYHRRKRSKPVDICFRILDQSRSRIHRPRDEGDAQSEH